MFWSSPPEQHAGVGGCIVKRGLGLFELNSDSEQRAVPVEDVLFDMRNSSSASRCLKIASGHCPDWADALWPGRTRRTQPLRPSKSRGSASHPERSWRSERHASRVTSPRSFSLVALASAGGITVRSCPKEFRKHAPSLRLGLHRGPACARKGSIRNTIC